MKKNENKCANYNFLRGKFAYSDVQMNHLLTEHPLYKYCLHKININFIISSSLVLLLLL